MRHALALVFALVWLAAGTHAQAPQPAGDDVIKVVRQAIADKDFARGEKLVADHRAKFGVTPEGLAALSWLGRGALAEKRLDAAERYAESTYKQATALLPKRRIDDNGNAPFPIALGAAIEVLAQVDAARGARTDAVNFLRTELATHKGSSIEKRLQKNLNLLSLEGTTAPALDLADYVGPPPPALSALKGKVVLLFFWAHWCNDCKAQGPVLADLAARYKDKGLVVLAPTQRFGYVAGGQPAGAAEEARYIDSVRQTAYGFLAGQPIPLSEANHRRYGVSTTPTLVMVDREGIVRLYNPGKMTAEALEPLVRKLTEAPTRAR